MQQCEDKFKRKAAYFRLPSMAQKRRMLKFPTPTLLQPVSAEGNTWEEISVQLSCQCHVCREGPVSKFP